MSVDIADVMMLMLFGALLVMLGFWVGYVLLRPFVRSGGTSLADLLASASRVEEEDEEPEPEEEPQASLPVDPSNPPFLRTYHRREGRPPRVCHCHARELQDGEQILFWPDPDTEGAFWLVCPPEDMVSQP